MDPLLLEIHTAALAGLLDIKNNQIECIYQEEVHSIGLISVAKISIKILDIFEGRYLLENIRNIYSESGHSIFCIYHKGEYILNQKAGPQIERSTNHPDRVVIYNFKDGALYPITIKVPEGCANKEWMNI